MIDSQKIRLCNLLVDGGPGTLEIASKSIQRETPVIIWKGTCKVGDVLELAYEKVMQKQAKTYL